MRVCECEKGEGSRGGVKKNNNNNKNGVVEKGVLEKYTKGEVAHL